MYCLQDYNMYEQRKQLSCDFTKESHTKWKCFLDTQMLLYTLREVERREKSDKCNGELM